MTDRPPYMFGGHLVDPELIAERETAAQLKREAGAFEIERLRNLPEVVTE